MSPVLDPRLLAATRGLTLAARRLAAGVLPGLHASRQAGLAREFSQYRAYQPGDDPRHVDWKLFARSDRYYVRESEVETALTVRVLLDATASMRHADTTGPERRVNASSTPRACSLPRWRSSRRRRAISSACTPSLDGKVVSAPPGAAPAAVRADRPHVGNASNSARTAGPCDGRANSPRALASRTARGGGRG